LADVFCTSFSVGGPESLTKPIERFDEFRERVRALRYEERLGKQDGQVTVRPALAAAFNPTEPPPT
jgi:hypothetical protein